MCGRSATANDSVMDVVMVVVTVRVWGGCAGSPGCHKYRAVQRLANLVCKLPYYERRVRARLRCVRAPDAQCYGMSALL